MKNVLWAEYQSERDDSEESSTVLQIRVEWLGDRVGVVVIPAGQIAGIDTQIDVVALQRCHRLDGVRSTQTAIRGYHGVPNFGRF